MVSIRNSTGIRLAHCSLNFSNGQSGINLNRTSQNQKDLRAEARRREDAEKWGKQGWAALCPTRKNKGVGAIHELPGRFVNRPYGVVEHLVIF